MCLGTVIHFMPREIHLNVGRFKCTAIAYVKACAYRVSRCVMGQSQRTALVLDVASTVNHAFVTTPIERTNDVDVV